LYKCETTAPADHEITDPFAGDGSVEDTGCVGSSVSEGGGRVANPPEIDNLLA
jgi:hypothetical protein